jgi:hypothetical protein
VALLFFVAPGIGLQTPSLGGLDAAGHVTGDRERVRLGLATKLEPGVLGADRGEEEAALRGWEGRRMSRGRSSGADGPLDLTNGARV